MIATLSKPSQRPPKLRQRLAATDHVLLMADRAVRGLGGPGFETQTILSLAGRIDSNALQMGLDRLVDRYPVVTARLQEAEDGLAAWWQLNPSARCVLKETEIHASTPQAVLDHAAALLSTGSRFDQCDPIRFFLLHKPNGRDALIVQYNHTLLDNNAAIPLLAQLNALSYANARVQPRPGHDATVVREHLRRFDGQRRRRAMKSASRGWSRNLRGGIVQLGRNSGRKSAACEVRILARSLEPEAVNRFRQRVIETCGFPNLSMAILACAFRAIERLAPKRPAATNYMAGIGLDLGLRGHAGPLFGNPVSAVPIRARPEELNDRDELTRILGRQFREHLQNDADLGILQLMPFLSRRPADAELVMNLAMREGFSLWYAYFGSTDRIGAQFCGADIENVQFTGPAWPPMGLTLLANQFRGRLLLQTTYVPAAINATTAAAFLDELAGDLTADYPSNGECKTCEPRQSRQCS